MAERYELVIISIWSVLELFNVELLLKSYLNVPKKRLYIPELFLKSILFIFIIASYAIWISKGYSDVIISIIFCVLIIFKSTIILSSFYKININTIMIIAFFVELLSFIGFNLTMFFNKVLAVSIEFSIFDEILGECLILIILSLLILLEKENVITIWINELSVIDLLLFILILFNSGILESKFLKKPTFTFGIRVVIIALVISVVVLIVKSIIITEKKNSLEYVNYLLEEKMQLAIDHYKELTEKDNQVKKFRHDIKNHLLVIHAMVSEGESDRAISYIEELQEECSRTKSKFETGNFIADAIFSAKEAKAREKSIVIQYEGIIPSYLINDADLVVVLSNILDNAIEACEKIEGRQIIKIKSIVKNNLWILYSENPSLKVHIGNKKRIQTTKADKKHHGFGLQNIERTAKKYNGDMSINYEEGLFKTKTTFILDER